VEERNEEDVKGSACAKHESEDEPPEQVVGGKDRGQREDQENDHG
jgi:hypothetical protein